MAQSQSELNLLFRKLEGSAKELHLDVVDGKFAPNTSLNFPLSLCSQFTYNVHLMMEHPEDWIRKYRGKVDLFIPQYEALADVPGYISWMKSEGRKIAFALKPETKVKALEPYLSEIDYVLILTVHPGFYGSKFLKSPLKKIHQIKRINPGIEVIVDGGINPENIRVAAQAGADYFVSGSYVTKAEDPKKAIRALMQNLKA